MYFRQYDFFQIQIQHLLSYLRVMFISQNFLVMKKSMFFGYFTNFKHLQCCLDVDFSPPCHQHTSLSIALSRVSTTFLDRFLDHKTLFFVFFKSYNRFVTKGLIEALFQDLFKTSDMMTVEELKKYFILMRMEKQALFS